MGMTTPDLKPCPFCGGEDIVSPHRDGRLHCFKCGADGPVIPYAVDPKFWTWNTRENEKDI